LTDVDQVTIYILFIEGWLVYSLFIINVI